MASLSSFSCVAIDPNGASQAGDTASSDLGLSLGWTQLLPMRLLLVGQEDTIDVRCRHPRLPSKQDLRSSSSIHVCASMRENIRGKCIARNTGEYDQRSCSSGRLPAAEPRASRPKWSDWTLSTCGSLPKVKRTPLLPCDLHCHDCISSNTSTHLTCT